VAWNGFGLHLSLPVLSSLDTAATVLAASAALALFSPLKFSVIQTLLLCSLAGVVLQLIFGGSP
jgi:hypothetical protein